MIDQVFKYEIPVVHPIAVHFPIVLVLLVLLFGVLWLFRDRIRWLNLALFVQVLAFIASIVAYLSGQVMEEQSEGVPIVEELVHLHEDAALFSLWAIGISIAVMGLARHVHFANSKRPGAPFWLRSAVVLVLLTAAVLIVWTSHIGGTMVWGVIP